MLGINLTIIIKEQFYNSEQQLLQIIMGREIDSDRWKSSLSVETFIVHSSKFFLATVVFTSTKKNTSGVI